MADLAPDIKEVEIRRIDKTVVFAYQPGTVARVLPQAEGVRRAGRHGRLVAPSAVAVGELARPHRDARGHTERMGRDGVLVEHPILGQPRQRRRFTEGVAVEVAGGGFHLIRHDKEDIGPVGHELSFQLEHGWSGFSRVDERRWTKDERMESRHAIGSSSVHRPPSDLKSKRPYN